MRPSSKLLGICFLREAPERAIESDRRAGKWGLAIVVRGDSHAVQHEASVSKVSEDMIFYMQQRGLTEAQAMSLAVNGFVNDLVRQFPMEYSVELKRLIDLEMEGSVG